MFRLPRLRRSIGRLSKSLPRRGIQFEPLEERRLMAVSAFHLPPSGGIEMESGLESENQSVNPIRGGGFHTDPNEGVIVDGPGIPALSSLPGAPVNIYLDFDGNFEPGPVWDGVRNVSTEPFSIDADLNNISEVERRYIHKVWTMVADDFVPFNINVTTVNPGSFAHGSGNLQVAFGGADYDPTGNINGIAADFDAFTKEDVPNIVFVFPVDRYPKNPSARIREPYAMADTVSHEVGHAFGLHHFNRVEESPDGEKRSVKHSGDPPPPALHANRAPLMGDPSSRTRGVGRAVWWIGEAENGETQDDMAVLSRPENGFGYRPDDHGKGFNLVDSSPMSIGTLKNGATSPMSVLIGSGVIETNDDVDVFRFETGGGNVAVRITGPKSYTYALHEPLSSEELADPSLSYAGHLAVRAALVDSAGNQIASNENVSLQGLYAGYRAFGNDDLVLEAGTYYLTLAGVSGDTGQYTVSVTEDRGARIVGSEFISENGASVGLAVTFDEPIDPHTFSPHDVRVNSQVAGEGGLDVTPTADPRTFLISWAPTHAHTMIVNISSNIADQFGNLLDQNQDGVGGELEDHVTVYLVSRPQGGFGGEVIGPTGFAASPFIAAGEAMASKILFANDPTLAGAPAKEVTIAHQLDGELDWSSFAFGNLGWGSVNVDVPEGAQSFATQVEYINPMHVDAPLLVEVSARFDAATGVAVWILTSVDPATGLAPEGVFEGFLPPNRDSHLGQGFVEFTVRSKQELPTGAQIEQRASISMDGGSPIDTLGAVRYVDADTPKSSIDPLPSIGHHRAFPVTWSGEDGQGSGVRSFDVFVSIDGGDYRLWLEDAMLTESLYSGAFGHSYAFYSIATDNVGHVELGANTPDAVTQLVDPATVDFVDGVVIVTGGPDYDNVTFYPGKAEGQVIARVNGRVFGPFASPTKLVAFGNGGNDRIAVERVYGTPPAEFHGGSGNDRLYGGYANDSLYGDEGRDYLEGFNGHDRLFGGDDDDVLHGGFGNDVLYGESGNDRLRGYVGNDLLFGGEGRDYLNGDVGNNVLVGGDGNDRLGAKAGRNIIIGGIGRDLAAAGSEGAILIGGATNYDASEVALLALLEEWSSSRTLDQRISRMTTGVGLGNQYALTIDGTVQDDHAWNVLEGSDGEDWFLKFRKNRLLNVDAANDRITSGQ